MLWPASHLYFTDVYFLRSLAILQQSQLNPFIRAQVFIRQGPGKIYGLNNALEVISRYSQLIQHGGRVFTFEEGSGYESTETVLVIEGLVQDLITLETMLLGVISAATSVHNDQTKPEFSKISEQMQAITKLVKDRPVYYFGARHWSFDQDENISRAAWTGGAAGCSTQIGAAIKQHQPVGTIPHSLEAIFAWKYGRERAVVETTLAFDKYMPREIPRVALVDFNNREIDDSVGVCRVMGSKLTGIRIDTCGENVMQGGLEKGVSVSGVVAVRKENL